VGKRNGGGEVEGVKKGTKEGGEVVGQTREKEGKRRGESGWLGEPPPPPPPLHQNKSFVIR
jgi:hypothetical protein